MNCPECRLYLLDVLRRSINADYILLDLPYFTNVGDMLIWQAAQELLLELPYKCLYSASIETYTKKKISENVIIIFMGGGNFGDLWIRHQLFRRVVMSDYPNNPILQLPQSVCFLNPMNLKEDIPFWDLHKGKITICLRDLKSYSIIKENYKKVTALHTPDLALAFDAISFCKENKIELNSGLGSLFVRRKDIEENESQSVLMKIPQNIKEADWPTMEKTPKIYLQYQKWIVWLDRFHVGKSIKNRFTDYYYEKYIRTFYISEGIQFLLPFSTVYSTRLHSAILAFLLGKTVYIIDNSYGKCKGVYEDWLSNQSTISML